MNIQVWPPNRLVSSNKVSRCVIGRGGITVNKREGDYATPAGLFPLRRVFYRADRLDPPATDLPLCEIRSDYGWCDDPADDQYNRLVVLPHVTSHEILWRDDGIYDVFCELGYNDAPVVPGRGSAIFLHVARPNFAPTEGCVALQLPELLAVLERCDSDSNLRVNPGRA